MIFLNKNISIDFNYDINKTKIEINKTTVNKTKIHPK